MKTKNRIALLMVIIMLLNLFSPYIPLLNNRALAATGVLEENPLILNNLGITQKGANRILNVEIALVSEAVINGFDLQFKVDTSKLSPCNKNTGAATSSIAMIMSQSDYYAGTLQIKTYDKNTSTFHFTATEQAGGFDIAENGYIPGEVGDPAIDDNGAGFPVYYPVLTLSFKVMDDSITEDNITLDMFELVPITIGLPTGLKVNYNNTEGIRVSKDVELGGKNFAEPEKEIESIEVTTEPTNTTYNHGDNIDLSGGKITVKYTDQSQTEIDMTDPAVSILSGSPANVNNQKVTLSYKGKTCDFDIQVNDPISSLAVTKPMNDLEYNHGENFDFSGLELTATKLSGATEKLTSESEGVSISETQADVNSLNFTQTSDEGDLPVKGTQKITFTYEGKTASQTVVVNDTIAGIDLISQPNKKVYKYGESLDLDGASVKITLGSGSSTSIDLPDGSIEISEYNPTMTGAKQNLTVSLNGMQATDTIDVEAYNYIKETKLTEPNKAEYKYGEDLNLAGGRLALTWADGRVTNVNLSEEMVTGYDKTQIKLQELTVTYEANYELSDGSSIKDTFKHTFEVEVINQVESIEITPPTKTIYNHGESLNLEGGSIKVIYADASSSTVDISQATITESDDSPVNMSPASYDNTNKVSKTLKISYTQDDVTKEVDYPIEIINDVKSISMNTTPKTQYNVNDSLSLENGDILVTRAVGTEVISLSDSRVEVTGFDSKTENPNLQLTVKFTENGIEKTTTYNVSVTDTITGIELISQPDKTDYKYGESINLDGAMIEITKGSGKTQIAVDEGMISSYNPNQLGKQELTVTYQGHEVTDKIVVNVNDYVTGIRVTPPTKTNYKNGEDLELDGGTVTKIMASGEPGDTVDLEEGMITTEFDSSIVGPQDITVELEGFQDKFTVTVEDYVTDIEIVAPTKTTYNHGDELDLSGGSIKVIYASASPKTVDISNATITENDGSPVNMSPESYDSTNKVSKALKIKYTEDGVTKEIDYQVEIINDVKSISMHTNPKTDYNVNESLSLENGEILVTRATGVPEVIDLSNSNVEVTGFNSSVENPSLELTVKYTENGISKTTTYNVSVTDTITGIELISQLDKTDYKYGESINLEGAMIEVTKGSGKTQIAVDEEMISTYNPNQLGEQQLTVTYEGHEAADKIIVNVNDYVTGIKVTPPTKTNYEKDEQLDLTGGLVTSIMASGEPGETVDLEEDMITTEFDSTQTGPQELTVEYGEFTDTFTVTVADYITEITINESPKTEYKYGEELGTPGGSITVHYQSGATQNVNITPDMITDADGTPFDTTDVTFGEGETTANKDIKITYKGFETTYEITIKDYITNVEITPPSKTEYKYNEDLDLSAAKVTVTMASKPSEPKEIPVTSEMISGYDKTQLDEQTVTIKYTDDEGTEHTKQFEVNVVDEITSMELEGTPKTDYTIGEDLDLSGLNVLIHKSSGDERVPVTEEMISGYNKDEEGSQTVIVTYNGQEVGRFEVNVANPVERLEWITKPKTSYVIGDLLEVTGGKFKAIKKNGDEEEIDLTEEMVSGFDSSTTGNKTLTVTYEEKELTYQITVADRVDRIEIQDMPKTEYKYGEELEKGGTIKVIKASGETETVDITPDMITGYDKTQLGPQNVTINYGGQTVDFEITVKDYITNVEITPPSKTEYKYNEDLDLSDAKVTVTMASKPSEPKEIPVTSEMISGYDKTQLDEQTVTIKYTDDEGTEYTKQFEVTVVDVITEIAINETPKNRYNYGEELGTPGGSITVKYQSGANKVVNITPDMITDTDGTPFDTTDITFGEGQTTANKTQKVIYEEFETTYEITIVNGIKGIRPTEEPKKNYVIGEEFQDDLVIEVEREDGTKVEIPVTDEMVSGFDTDTEGPKEITITYEENGIEKEYTYEITVTDRVNKIEITKDPKKDYKYGEDLVAGGEITVEKASGESEVITITPDMITGYDKTQLGPQNVTINYGGQTVDFELTVSDYITGVVITPPSKVEYEYGEDLDLSDAKVTITMASTPDKPKEVPVTSDMISGYDKTKVESQTVTITYRDDEGQDHTKQFGVTVIDKIKSITLETTGAKIEYKYGENLDLTNVKLNVVYESGKTDEIPVNTGMISGYDSEELGNQTITVQYQDFKDTFEVTVNDYLKDINLTPPTKYEYEIGEYLDLTGGKITEIMASGASGISLDLTPDMVSGFDSATPGTKRITVTYQKDGETYTKYFEVSVINSTNKIEVVAPNKTDYKYGEDLDLTGGKIIISKADGTEEEKELTKDMISGYDKTNPGQQVITVTYTDENNEKFTGSFIVNVGEDYVVGYEFTAPSKTDYKYGEDLDLTGGKITEIMASGNKGKVTEITKDMVSGYNPEKEGTQEITVTHNGNEYTFNVTVKDEIQGISIKKYPNKLEYKQGEELDVTGGILNVIKTSGIHEVEITKDMVSGFNPNKSGIQIITVTYEGFTAEYMVYVEKDEETTPPIVTPDDGEDDNNNTTPPSTDNDDTNSTTPGTDNNNSNNNNNDNNSNNDNNNTNNNNNGNNSNNNQTNTNSTNENDNNENTEDEKEQNNHNNQNNDENIPPVIGNVDDNTPPSNNSQDYFNEGFIRGILAGITGLITLAGILLLIILFAKDRKNVKVYIEEGDERVLVGKEKITRNNRSIDLNKYYDKYKEDEYKVVLSKSISKKLDNKTVNITVHDKNKKVKVNYQDEKFVVRT